MNILAIIPARGGSKSIPTKNIRPVAGKPLIAWTIQAALASHHSPRVIVSTDHEQIAETARCFGAEVPFLRPAELAQDDTPGIAPILHAAQWLAEQENYHPDFVMCLQPTSPLRVTEDIDQAIDLLLAKAADAVVSVTPADHHPYWMKRLDPSGRLGDFAPHPPTIRRQDLPAAYALNGAIYVARCEVLLGYKTWYTDKTYGYVMPPERSIDVDSQWDMYLADLIMKNKLLGHDY